MIGSAAIGALIVHVAFWSLVLLGLATRDLGPKLAAAFVIVWLTGRIGLSYMPYGAPLFPSCVAVLDIVLVFIIVKGDVRLT